MDNVFWDDFAREELKRMTRQYLPTDEILMRNNPVIRDIIVANRRRKRAFRNVTLGHIERLMGTPFLYTDEEVFGERAGGQPSKLERDLIKSKDVIVADLKAQQAQIQSELADAVRNKAPQEEIDELKQRAHEKKKQIRKYYEPTYRRKLRKGETPDDFDRDERTRHQRRRAYYQREFVEEAEGQRHGGFDKRRAQYIKIWDKELGRYKSIPKPKQKAPISRVDLSGGRVRDLTPAEIARQIIPETPRSYAELAGERIEGIYHKKWGFRVVVDDIEDVKLTKAVLRIVETSPQTLVELDKETGKTITKAQVKIGNKQVPAEVFRQAYRSLPPAKKQASAKILARIAGRAFVPLGIALTVYDVISLLSWGQEKLKERT